MVRNDPFVKIRLEFTGKVPRWMNQVLCWNPSRCHGVMPFSSAVPTTSVFWSVRPALGMRTIFAQTKRWRCYPFMPQGEWGDQRYLSSLRISTHLGAISHTPDVHPVFRFPVLTGWVCFLIMIFPMDIPNGYSQWIFPMDIPNGYSHMISTGSPRTQKCVNRICCGGWPSQYPAKTVWGSAGWTLPLWRYRFQGILEDE